MPGSRKFTSNLHEISHLICAITSESCLESSSVFKHCFGLDIEATVEPGYRVKSLQFQPAKTSVSPRSSPPTTKSQEKRMFSQAIIVSTLQKYSEVNLRHATVELQRKLKALFCRVDKFNVVYKSEEHFQRISGKTIDFIILHRNRVDSADAEKVFRESTVRISDCRASSILKTVPVSQDFMLNASLENLSTTIRNLYLDLLGISEQTLNTLVRFR